MARGPIFPFCLFEVKNMCSSVSLKDVNSNEVFTKSKKICMRTNLTSLSQITWGYTSIVFFCFICYWNSLEGDLVHDDIFAIKNNNDVTGTTNISSLFFHDFWGKDILAATSHKSYRPLCTLSFRLNHALSGLAPLSYHVTNVVLHVACSALLYRLCLTTIFHTRKTCALLAATIFAVHPVHTEAVSGVVGRADLLSSVLFLLALSAFTRAQAVDSKFGQYVTMGTWLLVTVVMTTLSTLSKELGITALGVCCIVELYGCARDLMPNSSSGVTPGHRKNTRWNLSGIRTGSMIAAGCCLLAGRLWVMGGRLPTFLSQDNPASFSNSTLTRVLTFSYLASFNAQLLLFPWQLSYDWQGGSIPLVENLSDPRNLQTLACVAVIACLLYAAIKSHQKSSPIVWGLALLVIPFLPASNVFFRVGFVVAERVLYIPSLGYCVLVAAGWDRLRSHVSVRGRTCLTAVTIAAVLLLATRTIVRNRVWASRTTLFMSGVQSLPQNAKMHYNYGNLLKDEGSASSARHHYLTAARLAPDHPSTWNNLGTVTSDRGEAMTCFRRALQLLPSHTGAMYNLAIALSEEQQYDEAVVWLETAISIAPHDLDPYYALANIYQRRGEPSRAEDLYRTLLIQEPNNANVHNNWGVLLHQAGDLEGARHHYELATSVDPTLEIAALNLARVLRLHGKFAEAHKTYRQIVLVHPKVATWIEIATFYSAIGETQQARATLETVLKTAPEDRGAVIAYVQHLSNHGSIKAAESILRKFLEKFPNDLPGLRQMAALYGRQGRHREAINMLVPLLSSPSFGDAAADVQADVVCLLADNYKDTKQLAEALEYYHLCVGRRPDSVEANVNIGVIYHLQKNYDAADGHYAAALSLRPDDALLQENMAKLRRTRSKLQ